ncbi:hypothetical protein FGO68_gene4813 [Halteria grandinella]|uniref:Uncharacterized protein n=1 Tax=Halteria grandinella TaxID=5974 RepID=A0A8J8NUW6_HALGN|nr:hypothetical protein FGO68_gene4813 [Halteria grandinella]
MAFNCAVSLLQYSKPVMIFVILSCSTLQHLLVLQLRFSKQWELALKNLNVRANPPPSLRHDQPLPPLGCRLVRQSALSCRNHVTY